MAIPGVEMHDYRKKSLFQKAKEALDSYNEKKRAERPARIHELKERTKELRAEAGYNRAARSLEKSKGNGGMWGGGDIGSMFLGNASSKKRRSGSILDW